MEPAERRNRNVSAYNAKARELASAAIRYLALFLTRQTEEEIAKVLDQKTVDGLVRGLSGNGSPQYTPRHFRVAQQVVEAAGHTMRQFLAGERNSVLLLNMLDQGERMMMQLSKPLGAIKNPGCEGWREMIYKDLGLSS